MIKVCSLEFVNKEFFGADIMTVDGRTLCAADEIVTPEKILKLYFKDIYVENPLEEEYVKREKEKEATERLPKEATERTAGVAAEKAAENEAEEATEKATEKAIEEVSEIIEEELIEEAIKAEEFEEVAEEIIDEIVEEINIEEKEQAEGLIKEKIGDKQETKVAKEHKRTSMRGSELPEEDVPVVDDDMQFDEEQAQRVSDCAVKMGKKLKFSLQKLDELKQAAYYHKIGVTKFKKEEANKKDFKKVQAQAGYDIVLEKEMPQAVAEAVKLWVVDYDSNAFSLEGEIPYAHIIAICDYYDNSVNNKNRSKEETLLKMLQFGGNKFNIFVLHKFVKMMGDSNGE